MPSGLQSSPWSRYVGDPPSRVSPAPGVRPGLLRGDAGAPRDRVLVGGRRAPVRVKVSDTTLRARRDEWEEAGVFDAIVEEALHAYDKIIGLDLTEVAVDGAAKSPGGDGTGKTRRPGKIGWKWSILTDAKASRSAGP